MIGYAAKIPLGDIEKIELFVNVAKRPMAEIKVLLGCDHIMNAGFFNTSTFKPVFGLTVQGRVLSTGGNPYGYAFDGGKIAFSYGNNVKYPNFVAGYPCLLTSGQVAWDKDPAGLEGDRGRSAMGLTQDSLVLRCVPDVDGTSDYTLQELAADMRGLGCINAINLDGGGSSQCDFAGQQIISSRIVHSFLCVWLKKDRPHPRTYTNGAARKTVYETTACKKSIGSLDPYETSCLLHVDKDFAVVSYFITGKSERKAGFIRLN